jgi:hypothetical protein
MMQCASNLFMDKATQRCHPAYERVPWHILLGIGIGLDPQAIAHRGDRTLEQLILSDLGLEEGLKRGGRRLGLTLLFLQL